jgi:hypothetical protein
MARHHSEGTTATCGMHAFGSSALLEDLPNNVGCASGKVLKTGTAAC